MDLNGKLTKVAEISYRGKGVSFNAIYSQGTWFTRSNLKNKYKAKFIKLINENKDLRWMDRYVIEVVYNSRHDPDNVIAMEKIFVDTIKQKFDKEGNIEYHGFIRDDSKKYCRGVVIRPEEDLPTDTFKFVLYEYGD